MSFKKWLIPGLIVAIICIIRVFHDSDDWPRLPVVLGLFLTFFIYFVVASALDDWIFKKFNVKKTWGNGRIVGLVIFLLFLPLFWCAFQLVFRLGKT